MAFITKLPQLSEDLRAYLNKGTPVPSTNDLRLYQETYKREAKLQRGFEKRDQEDLTEYSELLDSVIETLNQ